MRKRATYLLVSLLALPACRQQEAPVDTAAPRPRKAPEGQPVFDGVGAHVRKVTTASPDAQKYFDQGLAFLYAFNHDEAIRSFAAAAGKDPSCAMAFWGIATANGPHINNPTVDEPHAKAAVEALAKATAAGASAGELEKALIAAAGKRFASPPPADRKPLDEAYAAAMREIWKANPDDADVGALFAEALMDLRPWDLWAQDGKPQPGTGEVLATLEAVLGKRPDHPLANHLYIHAVEASPTPEKADAAADRLRTLMPGMGHMVHMPSHIDVRRGRWKEAEVQNRLAMAADKAYREKVPGQGFYRVYMAHNHHMLAFAGMMRGRSEESIRVIREMVAGMPPEFVKETAPFVDGYMAMPLEVLMRFGKWDEILKEPDFPEYLPLARTLRRYARGVSYAALGKLGEARAEEKAFEEARKALAKDAFFGNNSAADIVALAEEILEGEILVASGKVNEGIARLRKAVTLEDRLRYDEPPDWIQPTRHPLGAALLKAGKAAEAQKVFEADLKRLPGNVWGLYGLARSLKAQKKDQAAAEVEKRFAEASAEADTKIDSSCLCLPGV